MMRWLRAWLLRNLNPQPHELPVMYFEPVIDPVSMGVIQHFFKNANGADLLRLMTYRSQQMDTDATLQAQNVEHACGVACGYRMALAHLIQLSSAPSTPVGEQTENAEPEVSSGLEHLTP